MRNPPDSTNFLTQLMLQKLLLRLRTFDPDVKPKALLFYRIIVNSFRFCQLPFTARYYTGDYHLHRPDMSWDRCGRRTATAD